MIYFNKEQLLLALERAGIRAADSTLVLAARGGAVVELDARETHGDNSYSRIGGDPDLEPETPWPQCGSAELTASHDPGAGMGIPLYFLMQLDTDELRSTVTSLPPGKLLSFFAAIHRGNFPMTGGNGDDWKVIIQDKCRVERRSSPEWSTEAAAVVRAESSSIVARGGATAAPVGIQMRPCITLPLHTYETLIAAVAPYDVTHSPERIALLTSELQQNALFTVFGNCMNVHEMFAANLIHSARRYAAMHHPDWLEEWSNDGPEEWVNLAFVSTSEEHGIVWKWHGTGVFIIRHRDLVALRFERSILVTNPRE